MQPTLDYACKATGPRTSRLAVVACILGILSGPVAFVINATVSQFEPYLSSRYPEANPLWGIALLTYVVVYVPTVFISIAALLRVVRSHKRLKGLMIARVGVLTCFAWIVLTLLFLLWALSIGCPE